jgi:hypothetical protein
MSCSGARHRTAGAASRPYFVVVETAWNEARAQRMWNCGQNGTVAYLPRMIGHVLHDSGKVLFVLRWPS